MMYFERPQIEKDIIRMAYDFEINAIEECDATRNPWFDEIQTWEDGKIVWSVISDAVEMAYCDQQKGVNNGIQKNDAKRTF